MHLILVNKNQQPCSNVISTYPITKTYLYNFDPLKPYFYIEKTGFTQLYNIFLIAVQKLRLLYSLEPPRRGGSNEYPQSVFWTEVWKTADFFYVKTFSFWWWNFNIFDYACFRKKHYDIDTKSCLFDIRG